MSNAIDTPSKVTATAAASLAKQGITYVGRYLGHSWKGIDKAEADAIKAAGLQIFSIYETNPTKAAYFTYAQGKADAFAAAGFAQEIGQPSGTAIYFTVDYDAQSKDFDGILSYFKGIKDNLKGYAIGVYGSYSVLTYLQPQNIAKYYMQTYAWSNGQHCKFNHIYQYKNDQKLSGLDVDFCNLEQSDCGAWGKVQPAQPSKTDIKPAVQPTSTTTAAEPAPQTAKNGWEKANGQWYFYKNGQLVKNDWAQDSKKLWYYLGADGVMQTNKWVKWKDKWYYLKSDGIMAAAEWVNYKDKWYYVDAHGAMQQGWLQYKRSWYYLNPAPDKGEMMTGWITDKGKKYYLDAKGKMITGKQVIGDKTYVFDDKGDLKLE
jgi:glucan-binding YG repeat protein